MKLKKLQLKKDTIAELTASEASSIHGGEEAAAAKTANSTEHGFTCCWCTDIDIIVSGTATPGTYTE